MTSERRKTHWSRRDRFWYYVDAYGPWLVVAGLFIGAVTIIICTL